MSVAMHPDTTHETAQDSPAPAWQHQWKRAARDDRRMKAAHLAVVDAYAEHYYAGREALRGVGLSPARLAYWTRHGATTIREARADLVRWGWLGLVKAHGRGMVARYALVIPDAATLGISGEVIPKESATRTVKTSGSTRKESATRTVKAVKSPRGGDIPLPSPHRLPTSAPRPAADDQAATTTGPRRGRLDDPSSKSPKTARAGSDELRRAIPPAVLSSARGAHSAPVLTAALADALAVGWTPEQVRAELDGADAGARNPVGVVVSRLRGLAAHPPAPARPASITDAQIQSALAAGQECEHGNPDILTAANLPYCPICRRQAATA